MNLRPYLHVYTLELGQAVAYRISMLLSVFFGPAYFAVNYYIWRAIFELSPQIAGYEFIDMVRYYAVSTIILYLMWDDSDTTIRDHVRQGTLSQILLRPYHLFFIEYTRKIAHRTWALILESLPILALFFLVFGAEVVSIEGPVLYMLVGVWIATTMMFCLKYIVGLIAFWTIENTGSRLVVWFLFQWLLGGTLFPLDVLPMWAQEILLYLPFQHLVYAPTIYWNGASGLAGSSLEFTLVMGFVWLVIFGLLIYLIQKLAYNKYQGVGQ